MNKQPRIALITTGGTIAMAATAQNDKGVVKFTSRQLTEAVPQITEIALIEPVDLLSKASQSLTFADFLTLHAKIMELAPSCDGIVITHGTNTLEETAFALSLLLDLKIPVVLTGAMRRADMPGADGPANLLDAVRVACSEAAKGNGVLVVMNGEIISGLFAKKQHSFLPQAFSSQAIGWVAEDRVRIFFKPTVSKPVLKIGAKTANILTLECGFDAKGPEFECIDYSKIDALILNMTGVGHISENAVPAVAAIAKEIPVIFASRTGAGETFKAYYGSPGTEGDLLSKGLIAGGFLNSRQIRMLLLIAFSSGDQSHEQIKALLSYFN